MSQMMKPFQIVQAVATPTTAERLATTRGTWAKKVELIAQRVDAANTGDVWVGVDNTVATGNRIITLEPGDPWDLILPAGYFIDLYDLWIDAGTATDGVTGIRWW